MASKKPFALEYDIPLWSPNTNKPPYPYYLEVLRNHQSTDTIPLDKHAFYVIGRESSLSDIAIANPSISRQHCIIQFRSEFPKDARLYLYDLKSANGTFWNKKRVKPFTYIPLRLGDQLQFGASNTIYVIASQDEWVQQFNEERLQEEQNYIKKQSNTPQTKKRKEPSKEREESDDENRDDEDEQEADFDDDLDVRKRSRIEDNYYDTRDFDDEQDEFFDRVGVSHKKVDSEEDSKSTAPQVETLESLTEKREKITNRILELKKQLQTKSQQSTVTSVKKTEEAEEDALEAYMNTLQQQEQKQDASKIQIEIDQLEAQKAKLNKLITIATPAISLAHLSHPTSTKSKKVGNYLCEMDIITEELFQQVNKK